MTNPETQSLIAALDLAVAGGGCSQSTCSGVQVALETFCRSGGLAPELLETAEQGYARHLLHHDSEDRYAVIVMVWDVGQGTPIHDHADMWCVECVYTGEITVESFELSGKPDDDIVGFAKQETIVAGRGESGALIPPYDYHTIRCEGDQKAVTIHVYSGMMDWCNTFEDFGEGRFRRHRRDLGFASK